MIQIIKTTSKCKCYSKVILNNWILGGQKRSKIVQNMKNDHKWPGDENFEKILSDSKSSLLNLPNDEILKKYEINHVYGLGYYNYGKIPGIYRMNLLLKIVYNMKSRVYTNWRKKLNLLYK